MKSGKTNERAGVDAGCTVAFAFERAWSGTTQRKRLPAQRRTQTAPASQADGGHAFRAIGAAAARRLIRSVSRIWKVTIISEVGIFGRISGAASWLAEVWERG